MVRLLLTDLRFDDNDNCRTFYSKLDPIAWSEWNINSYGMGTGNYRLCQIWSSTDKIPTFINPDPTVYVMAFFTDSTEASPVKPVMQILILDGGD